jgi:TrmH family RNA methyltransferase
VLSSREARLIRGLRRRKIREQEGLFLAEGVRVVEDLLASGLPLKVGVVSPALEDTPRGTKLARDLEAACPVRRVPDRTLEELAATETPQGVLVVAQAPRWELGELEVGEAAVVLVLDGIQDPGNFGTLVRTADALGVVAVAALPGTVDPWNPKSVRSAAGSLFRVPVVQPRFDELAAWLDTQGFTLYAADAQGAPAEQFEWSARAALAVGNEGAGLSPEVRRAAAALVSIPIRGGAESLNVGVAAGILLYLLTRRR